MKKILPILILVAGLLQISCNDDLVSGTTTNPVDVYVAGQKDNQACYWKNNQPVLLNSGGIEGPTATKIIVTNNDVYVLGIGVGSTTLETFPMFWKNGVLTNLKNSLGTNEEEVVSITDFEVDGNDVYFLGYTKKTLIAFDDYSLAYWKNDVKTLVHNYGGYAHNYSKIKIANNTVYIAASDNGTETINGFYVNTVFNEIPNAVINGFAVNNNEIYAYGALGNNGYYKNISTNSETTLPSNLNGITRMLFDNNNMFITNGNDNIYKNGVLFEENQILFGGIMDFKILNDNIYKITQVGDFGFVSYLTINGVETMELPNSDGSFRSVFVVQN